MSLLEDIEFYKSNLTALSEDLRDESVEDITPLYAICIVASVALKHDRVRATAFKVNAEKILNVLPFNHAAAEGTPDAAMLDRLERGFVADVVKVEGIITKRIPSLWPLVRGHELFINAKARRKDFEGADEDRIAEMIAQHSGDGYGDDLLAEVGDEDGLVSRDGEEARASQVHKEGTPGYEWREP